MSGKDLKEILQSNGINLSELSKKLGYNSDQAFHSKLEAADVKSGLLEEIAKAINKSIGFFYDRNATVTAKENSVAVSGQSNSISMISDKFISLLEKKDEQTDRLIGIIEELSANQKRNLP